MNATTSHSPANLSVEEGLALLPASGPGWLCLDTGALPGMHPVQALCDGEHLLLRVADADPLAGFASGAEATVVVDATDGSRLRARGTLGPLDEVRLSASSPGETDRVLILELRDLNRS
jgi:hypothetical protein